MTIIDNASRTAPQHDGADKKTLIFPHNLPLEILRYIFELAAALDRKGVACTIALSSKLLRSWVDPLIYHTVALHTERGGESFTEFLKARSRSDPAFIPKRIKSISIMSTISTENRDHILQTCTGLSRLYLWSGAGTDSESEAEDAEVAPMEFNISHLPKITHFSFSLLPAGLIERLSPSLTHLSLFYEEDLEDIEWAEVFKRCPRISHLVVTFPGDTRKELTDFLADPDVPRLADAILNGYTGPKKLRLAIIPHALLTSAILPIPVDWIAQAADEGYLAVYPRTLLEEFDEEKLEVILDTAMDKEDVDMMLDDDTLPFGYFMYRFPFIEDEVWNFAAGVEAAKAKAAAKKSVSIGTQTC